jgi:hypothetical protein
MMVLVIWAVRWYRTKQHLFSSSFRPALEKTEDRLSTDGPAQLELALSMVALAGSSG